MLRKIKDYTLKERAEAVTFERRIKRIIPIIMSCLGIILVLGYVTSLMYSKFGDFTISVNKFNYVEYGLSLSETKDFSQPTSSLNCKATAVITNIKGDSLDDLDLGSIDGNSSGENYLCYTFYCKNAGEKPVSFEYSLFITEMTMDIEKAVRVRVITSQNGEEKTQTDYARVSSEQDKNGNYLPEKGTTPFKTKTTIADLQQDGFQPGDVMKYTIVIWLEGTDKDCVDEIIGGFFKIDMKFNVLGGSE